METLHPSGTGHTLSPASKLMLLVEPVLLCCRVLKQRFENISVDTFCGNTLMNGLLKVDTSLRKTILKLKNKKMV